MAVDIRPPLHHQFLNVALNDELTHSPAKTPAGRFRQAVRGALRPADDAVISRKAFGFAKRYQRGYRRWRDRLFCGQMTTLRGDFARYQTHVHKTLTMANQAHRVRWYAALSTHQLELLWDQTFQQMAYVDECHYVGDQFGFLLADFVENGRRRAPKK